MEALGGGAAPYRNGLSGGDWLVIKKADYQKLMDLLADKKQAQRPLVHHLFDLLAAGPMSIQELIVKSNACQSSVVTALRNMVDRNMIVKKRFHDPAWPHHANIGRWIYSLPETKPGI